MLVEPRSREAAKPRSREAAKPRRREAAKPRSREAAKPRSREAAKRLRNYCIEAVCLSVTLCVRVCVSVHSVIALSIPNTMQYNFMRG